MFDTRLDFYKKIVIISKAHEKKLGKLNKAVVLQVFIR